MSLSRNISTYEDVRAVLDAALTAGGGRVPFEDSRKATAWTARANMLRKLVAERDGSTPWDAYTIIRRDAAVLIVPRVIPKLETLDGEPLAPVEDDAGLANEVEALKRRLRFE